MTKHVTIALSSDEEAKLAALAQTAQSSVVAVVEDIVRQRLDYYTRYDEAIEEAREDIRSGRFLTHEEIVARAEKRRKEFSAKKSA